MDAVQRASKFTHTYLIEAHPVSITSKLLTIGFDPEFADKLGLVDNSKTHQLLQTKLAELGHPHVMVKFIVADAPDTFERPAPIVAEALPPNAITPIAPTPKPEAAPKPAAPPAAQPAAPAPAAKPKPEVVAFSKDDFKNDPLIQKALEIFKGQIVEVRA